MSLAEARAGSTAVSGRPVSGSWRSRYSRRLIQLDAAVIAVSVLSAQWLRFGVLPAAGPERFSDYTVVSAVIGLVWLAALSINRSRSPRVIGAGLEEYRRVVTATMWVFGGVAIASMLLKLEIARGYLVIALFGVVGVLAGRYLARRVVRVARRRHGRCMTRVLVVGNLHAVTDLVRRMTEDSEAGFGVVAACVPGRAGNGTVGIAGLPPIPILGDVTDVLDVLGATGCDAVALTATDQLDSLFIRDLSWQLEKLDVDLMVAPGVLDVSGPRLALKPVSGLPMIHVAKPQYNGAQRFRKRAFDLVFATAVLVLSSPLLAVVAIAVKLTSSGPVFYRSERIGRDGQPFQMIKFRTMTDGADTMLAALSALNECDGGVLFKMHDDPRVTPLGRVLRRYSIDEIPQFFNVLRREMSVVGPRPPLAGEVATYDHQLRRRLLVKPGITGLWQISGRSDLSWEDAVRLDLFYVENWSMTTDLLIALKTVRAMVGAVGAY